MFNFNYRRIPQIDALSSGRSFRVFKMEAGSGTGENGLSVTDENDSSARLPDAQRRRGVGVCNKR